MERTNTLCGSEYLIFCLPDRVGKAVLVEAMKALLASPHGAQVVLDFSATVHIDYRALRQFAYRLQKKQRHARPVWLAGLNPYCQEVVRFALQVENWDLFLDMDGEFAPVAPRGNGADAEETLECGQVRGAGENVAPLFFPPCPN